MDVVGTHSWRKHQDFPRFWKYATARGCRDIPWQELFTDKRFVMKDVSEKTAKISKIPIAVTGLMLDKDENFHAVVLLLPSDRNEATRAEIDDIKLAGNPNCTLPAWYQENRTEAEVFYREWKETFTRFALYEKDNKSTN